MVAATVSARPSKFRVIVNGIKWLCGAVGAKLCSWWPGPPLASGVSSQFRFRAPRNNGGIRGEEGGPRPRNTSGTRRTDIPRPRLPSRMSWQLTLASRPPRFRCLRASLSAASRVSKPSSSPPLVSSKQQDTLEFFTPTFRSNWKSCLRWDGYRRSSSALLKLKNATLFELV